MYSKPSQGMLYAYVREYLMPNKWSWKWLWYIRCCVVLLNKQVSLGLIPAVGKIS